MRGKSQKPQINAKSRPPIQAPQQISLSLRYLSKNKERNFEFFSQKEMRQKAQAFEQFLEFAKRLTSKTQLEISGLRKDQDCGFETLAFQAVNCAPDGCELSNETNIHVFRFGNNGRGGDYRLLSFFNEKSSVLNVIGFDFDYSAYDH